MIKSIRTGLDFLHDGRVIFTAVKVGRRSVQISIVGGRQFTLNVTEGDQARTPCGLALRFESRSGNGAHPMLGVWGDDAEGSPIRLSHQEMSAAQPTRVPTETGLPEGPPRLGTRPRSNQPNNSTLPPQGGLGPDAIPPRRRRGFV